MAESQSEANPRNVILILIDSLNRSHLSAYGPTPVATPNLDRFGQRAWRFENHYVGSLPCMPARREIFAGFKEMMWRPWGPLEDFDARLPRLLEAASYQTAIVTDHYHYWEESGNGYLQAFQQTDLVRGHEVDNWQLPDVSDEIPAWVKNLERWRPGHGRRYFANVRTFRSEDDFFPARVMKAATAWLQADRPSPFFLQIESFDVHEPFHLVEPYASMYGDPSGYERFTVWPPYQDAAQLAKFFAATTPDELAFIRSQYAGKVSMVDRWLGEVLDALDRTHRWDDTIVIVTTDHGHDLGVRETFGKQYPHYDTHAKLPLLVWHPDHPGGGRTISALTSTVDLFSTILDACDVKHEAVHGQSLMPLIDGDRGSRIGLLYGTFGQGVCCTDGRHTIFKSPTQSDDQLYAYTTLKYKSLVLDEPLDPQAAGHYIPDVAALQWRAAVRTSSLSTENFLFNIQEDPQQTRNLWATSSAERRNMLDLLQEVLRSEGAPPEQYRRLGLQQ